MPVTIFAPAAPAVRLPRVPAVSPAPRFDPNTMVLFPKPIVASPTIVSSGGTQTFTLTTARDIAAGEKLFVLIGGDDNTGTTTITNFTDSLGLNPTPELFTSANALQRVTSMLAVVTVPAGGYPKGTVFTG